MADQNTTPNPDIPTVADLQPGATMTGGVINPLSLKPIELNLPEPPRSYPPAVQPSTLIPTQKGFPTQSQQSAQKIFQMAETAGQWAKNPYHYGKEKAYNADYDGFNFKRYAAVPSVFNKEGVSFFRDNESLYNENASWWDYYKRSASSGLDLFKTGFSDMLPWNAWSSDETDEDAAIEMERAHAIGHDTRGGFGSWVNNMTVDSGYTFGILGEMAAEEAALWIGSTLAAPETLGASWAAAATEATANVAKGGKLLSKLWDLKGMYKGVNRTYDWLKGTEKARDIYNAAKTGVSWTAKQLLPETLKYGQDLFKSAKAGEIAFDAAKASKGFGAFYRDMRAYSAIMSESSLEGGSTELRVRDELIDEYRNTHNGEMPGEAELTNIYTQAANAGRETFLWNLPALYISNKIVFDKALKGFKPASAFREELELGIKGKLAFNEAWKQAGQKAWSVVDDGLKGTLKTLTTASTYYPKNLLKNGIAGFAKYTAANLTEGLQEVYQDAVSNTMTEYYKDRFTHPAVEGSRSIWGSFADNLGKTAVSGQGLETFASGFMMGSMVQVPQKVAFEWMPKKFWQITDREGYDAHMAQMEKHTNSVVDALNAATMDDKFWDGITENTVQQLNNNKQAQDANRAGDKKAYYDIVDEDVFNHMHTLLRSGKLSLIKDHLNDLKGLNQKDLEQAFGPVEKEEGNSYDVYQKRIDSMLKKADLVEAHYQDIEKRFSNPFDPSRYNKKKDPEAYRNELDAYHAYEEAKKAAVYSNYAFERAVDRMKGVMDGLVKDHNAFASLFSSNTELGGTRASDFTTILNQDTLNAEVELLTQEIDTYRQGDEESKAKADSLQQKLDRLKDYRDAVTEFQEALRISSVKRSGLTTEETTAADRAGRIGKGTVVKNKKGEAVEVDRVKKGIAYDKAGNRIGKTNKLEAIEAAVEKDIADSAAENLYEKYRAYLKHISTGKGVPIKEQDIQRSFQKLKDFYNLNQDARDMADAVDTLHNPGKFTEYASRASQVVGEIRKQRRSKLEESYKRFLRLRKTNDLFNQLYNMGVFLDEEGMKKVLDNQIPSDFYDISNKERIAEDSPKYKEILDLFEKFEETEGVTFEDKPIPEEEGDPEKYNYASSGRNKINNDKRTFKEHAEYWGFDPNPEVSSTVNTRDTLKKIIDSPFATKKEKMLARRLLTIVSKNSQITFGKLARPGEFRYSSEGKIGTFMDARYFSQDYKGGKNIPIEAILLHELIHEVTSMEMSKDAEFKSAISKLLAAAKAEYAKNPPTDPTLYKDATRREFYGLKNEDEFLAEMFSNDRFALWLDTIPYESTGKSAWSEFMEKLQNFLARILGVRTDSSLLQEAMYIATSRIDNIHNLPQPEKIGEEKGKVETKETKKTLTPGSSIQDLSTAGVLSPIIKAYKEFVKQQEALAPGAWSDPAAADKSDAEISQSPAFREFLTLNTKPVKDILDAYNGKAPKVEPAKTGVPLTITRQVRQQLLDLGYSNTDVNKMKPEEAQAIITEGKTKPKGAIPVSDIEAKKADIEKAKKLKMEWGNIIAPKSREVSEMLTSVYDFLNTNFNWGLTDFRFSKSKNALIFSIGDKTFSVEAQIGKMANGPYISNSLEEIVNAKYDAELAALEGKAPEAKVETKLATREQKKKLAEDLGYGKHWNEINRMTESEAAQIISEGRTREQRIADEESARIAEEQAEKMLKEMTMAQFENMIDKAEFISELEAIESDIAQAAFERPLDVDAERLDARIQAKKQELAKDVRFEDIQPNDVLIMKDGRRMLVEEKVNDVLKVRNFKTPGSRAEIIYEREVKNKVLYRDQPGMENVDINPPIDPETQDVSTQNVATAQNLNDTVKEDNDSVRNLTPEQVEEDFINSLGCR